MTISKTFAWMLVGGTPLAALVAPNQRRGIPSNLPSTDSAKTMKANRRQFLAAGAAIVALHSALAAAGPRSTPKGFIDCQSHLICHELAKTIQQTAWRVVQTHPYADKRHATRQEQPHCLDQKHQRTPVPTGDNTPVRLSKPHP
jgi:hypothetical protein